jgi:hypothetical protein
MKLSRNTELAVVAVLIAYLAFTPGFQVVRDILSNPIGKALFLALIVYVWKSVSAIVAVLLLVGYVRCASKGNVWEGMAMPPVTCTCEAGFTYNDQLKTCVNDAGDIKDPVACTCPAGYAYDVDSKECMEVSQETEPVSPTELPKPAGVEAVPAVPESAAPAAPSGPVTSTAPMTTPSAAQEMAAMPPAAPSAPAPGPVPSTTESFVGGYSSWY